MNLSQSYKLPANAVLNAKTGYGAVGDGVTDDTAALLAAIQAGIAAQKYVYLPKGTYLVSNQLVAKTAAGAFSAWMKLFGENRGETIIKLVDGATGFSDPATPKAVLFTASNQGTGSWDWTNLGEGNQAFGNYIEHLTIDAGNNPGAIGVDYLASNYAAMRDVTVKGNGPVGISLSRKLPGPELLKNVEVDGFDTAINAIGNSRYGAVLEFVTLKNQNAAGIVNYAIGLVVRHLRSYNAVPAVKSTNASALTTVIDSVLEGGGAANAAIDGAGNSMLLVKNVRTKGYLAAVRDSGTLIPDGDVDYYCSKPTSRIMVGAPKDPVNLVVEETPIYHENDLSAWASVQDFGATGTDSTDDTAAIQAALDSGASVVYFPFAQNYIVSDTLHARNPNLRMIAGFDSILVIPSNTFGDPNVPKAIIKNELTVGSLTIDKLYPGRVTQTNYFALGLVSVEQASTQPLIIRDSLLTGQRGIGKAALKAIAAPSSPLGDIFLENTLGSQYDIEGPVRLFARQMNAEGTKQVMLNSGATAWILGLKTEGAAPLITSQGGAETEVYGGVHYPVSSVPAGTVGYTNNRSNVGLSYMEISDFPNNVYPIHVRETQIVDGVTKTIDLTKDVTQGPVYSRGYAKFLPHYRGANIS